MSCPAAGQPRATAGREDAILHAPLAEGGVLVGASWRGSAATVRRDPWTNGQVKRMVRTREQAMVRASHYGGIAELRRRVADYLTAYNDAKHLKALRWRTPVEALEALEALWTSKDEPLRQSPAYLTLGPNT